MPNKLTKRQATPLPPPGWRSSLSRVIAFVFFLFIAWATAAQTPPEEGSLFVTLRLPYGISVEIPRSWHIVAGAAKEALGTGVAGDIDLSRMLVPDNHVLLRANATPSDQPASMAVAFFPRAVVDLQQEEPSPSELTAYDQELRQKVENALRSQGIELREWRGTHQDRLDGHFALVSEYRRQSQGFPSVWEQVNALPLNGGMAILSLTHSEQEGTLWRSVVLRIRSSFHTSETSSP
jgi:hypothetical protein